MFNRAIGLRRGMGESRGVAGHSAYLSALVGRGRIHGDEGEAVEAAGLYRLAIENGYRDDAQVFFNAYATQVFELKRRCLWKEWKGHLSFLVTLAEQQITEGMHSSVTAWNALLYPIHPPVLPNLIASFAAEAERNASRISPPTFEPSQIGGALRVGYMSSDWRSHTVCERLTGVIAKHTHAVTVFIITLNPPDDTPCRQRVLSMGAKVVDVSQLDDMEAVKAIHAAQLHVLVDLNGHTSGSRQSILVHQPALSQLTFFGWAGTAGTSRWIQGTVTDRVVSPPELVGEFVEPLVVLPPPFLAADYSSMRDVVSLWDLDSDPRSALEGSDLPETAVSKLVDAAKSGALVANFNRLVKLDEPSWKAWEQVLKTSPKAVLWLIRHPTDHPDAEINLLNRSAVRDRVVFTPQLDESLHLQAKSLVSLHLDTLSYGAHTTALDALIAGTPTVTAPGETMSERIGAGLAVGAGIGTTCVARSTEDMRQVASALLKSGGHKDIKRQLASLSRRWQSIVPIDAWIKVWERALRLSAESRSIDRALGRTQGWNIVVAENSE
mmetsp:Transcript_53378/g.125545  ORF Transcript_53378/g.125545 Transcript_53378/m.125545 type:complete len:552 (-) Transcript_53378:49-1704(-)